MHPPRLDRRTAALLLGGLSVLVLAAAVSLTGIAEQPFYTKGEPREAMVVWEMAHGGSLVLPLRNGTEIPSKPPFFHWLGLLAATLDGGVSELTTRLPSALLSIVAVLLTYAFGAWTGRIRSGWLASVSLLLSFEWLRATRVARVDMTLTFFVFAALLCFAVMDRRRVTRGRLILFYASIVAATLGKGPVGIALPALVILVYAATSPVDGRPAGWAGLRARLGHVLQVGRDLQPLRGLAVVLAVVGAWYAAALWIGGNDFFVKQVLKENLFRVIDPERFDSGHAHGPLYFLPSFLLGALPWSLLAPAIAWWLWRSRPLDPTTRYLVVWFATVVAFFSLSSSKRSVYILSAYPAAALLFGRVLGPGPEGEGPRRLAGWGMTAGAIAVGVLGIVALILASGLPVAGLVAPLLEAHDRQGLVAAAASLGEHRWIALAAALAVLGGAAVAVRAAPGAHWLRASAALAVALVALYGGIAAPVERGIARSRTLEPFLAEVRRRVGDEKLGFLCTFDYGAVYYSQRHFPAEAVARRCAGDGSHRGGCRDHLEELLEEEACRDPAQRAAVLDRPGVPRYLLLWENEVGPLAPRLDILLRSEGTGPKGRSSMVLATPRSTAAAGA